MLKTSMAYSSTAKKIKNRNPRTDPDHHQKSTTSRGSPLARACQVWSTSVSAFVQNDRTNERMTENDHITSPLLTEDIIIIIIIIIIIKIIIIIIIITPQRLSLTTPYRKSRR